MANSYLFYDLETTGLNKAFDQVQQCAIKRVDSNFNECESHFFEVRLSPDSIPSAYATITHQVSLQGDAARMPEIEAVKAIHRIFNTPGSISLGYNTLGFDDEFLRFSFYRNLLSPYTHQYAQRCGRMDIFPMTVFVYLYAQDTLAWPTIDGRVSLKLEAIAQENGWDDGRAHHAMHDVDATIKLAKALKNGNPKMWDYLTGFFQKAEDQFRIKKLPLLFSEQPSSHLGLLVSAKMGARQHFQAPVLALGWHTVYNNQMVWLRLDKGLIKVYPSYEALEEAGMIVKKKMAEPGFLLPWNDHYAKALEAERAELAQENLTWIAQNLATYQALAGEACQKTYPKIPAVDADAGLYELGFRSRVQDLLCRQLHDTPMPEWSPRLEKLEDDLIRTQGLRCLWRAKPDLLSINQQSEMLSYEHAVLAGKIEGLDYLGRKRRGVGDLAAEIAEIDRAILSETQRGLLDELTQWLQAKQEVVKSSTTSG